MSISEIGDLPQSFYIFQKYFSIRTTLENSVLSALQNRLLRDDLLKVFCDEYAKHLNLLHRNQNAALARTRIELGKLEKERVNLIQALKDGIPAALVKDDLIRVTEQKEKVEASLKERPAIKPLIHPAMAARFHKSVKDLRNGLNQDGSRSEASQLLRTLVDKTYLPRKRASMAYLLIYMVILLEF